MIIRRYEADTIEKAYSQVRRDLGPDAMIIQTQEKKAPGILAFLFGRKVIEVVAGKPMGARRTPPPKRPSGVWTRLTAAEGSAAGSAQRVREPAPTRPGAEAVVPASDEEAQGRLAEIQVLKNDMQELKSLVKTLIKVKKVPETLQGAPVNHVVPANPAAPGNSADTVGTSASASPASSPLPSAREGVPSSATPGGEPGVASPAASPSSGRSEGAARSSEPSGKPPLSPTVPPRKGEQPLSVRQAATAAPTAESGRGAIGEVCRYLAEHELSKDLLAGLQPFLEANLTERDRLEPHLVREKAIEYLAGMLKVSGGIRLRAGESTRLVALIGPTGVGKTTTVAKLAAGLKYNARLETAFVTIDTFRLGAPEQLKKYAEIIDVPLKIVFKPEDMKGAVEALGDRQVILIDTVGRSGRNRTDVDELRRFLCSSDLPIERHLLLSATTKLSDMVRILENFGEIGFESVIVTKLDETESYGSILSVLAQARETPVSFLTTGQGVPEDIQVADPSRIARLMFASQAAKRSAQLPA